MIPFLLAAAVGQGTATAPFVSEQGAYSVSFPSAPECEAVARDGAIVDPAVPVSEGSGDHAPVVHFCQAYDDAATYVVTYQCAGAPRPVMNLQGTTIPEATVVSRARVSIGNHAGTRMVLKTPKSTMHVLEVAAERGATYSLTASPNTPADTEKAVGFLDSFKILPRSDKTLCAPK